MTNTLTKLYTDLEEVCNRYIYRPCSSDVMHSFRCDCNRALAEANDVFIRYNLKAVLNYELTGTNIHGNVDFIDITTGNIITDINKYLQ